MPFSRRGGGTRLWLSVMALYQQQLLSSKASIAPSFEGFFRSKPVAVWIRRMQSYQYQLTIERIVEGLVFLLETRTMMIQVRERHNNHCITAIYTFYVWILYMTVHAGGLACILCLKKTEGRIRIRQLPPWMIIPTENGNFGKTKTAGWKGYRGPSPHICFKRILAVAEDWRKGWMVGAMERI